MRVIVIILILFHILGDVGDVHMFGDRYEYRKVTYIWYDTSPFSVMSHMMMTCNNVV